MRFSCFPVLPGSAEAQVIWGGILKRLLIVYFIGNISAKKYQNAFTHVKVIVNQRWDVFETQWSEWTLRALSKHAHNESKMVDGHHFKKRKNHHISATV